MWQLTRWQRDGYLQLIADKNGTSLPGNCLLENDRTGTEYRGNGNPYTRCPVTRYPVSDTQSPVWIPIYIDTYIIWSRFWGFVFNYFYKISQMHDSHLNDKWSGFVWFFHKKMFLSNDVEDTCSVAFLSAHHPSSIHQYRVNHSLKVTRKKVRSYRKAIV